MMTLQSKHPMPSLSKQEQRIIKQADIPPVFAQFLKEKSLTLGVAFALRVSASPHRYLMPASPKPISIKTKTGNWSFTKGVISVADELGTIEEENGKWKILNRNEHDLPKDADFLKPVLHRLSLQEVLSSLNTGGIHPSRHRSGYSKNRGAYVSNRINILSAAILFSVLILRKKIHALNHNAQLISAKC